MSRRYLELFNALALPFEPNEVKARNQGGRTLSYITARTAMNRLDTVLGPAEWWDDYQTAGESSILCRLTIRLPDGSTLTKCDAGGFAGMSDQGDDDKSGYSDAFKRAAVKFGVGRYLYRDGVPRYFDGEVSEPAPRQDPGAPPPGKGDAYEDDLPSRDPRPSDRPAGMPPRGGEHNNGNVPRSGKALFAWVKDMEQRYEVGLLKYLNGWAKLQEFPGRMVDWSGEQVAQAHGEAVRKLKSLEAQHADS